MVFFCFVLFSPFAEAGPRSGPLREWTIDSMESACQEMGLCRLSEGNERLKEAVKAKLKEKIQAALPVIAKEILYKELFLGAFGEEVAQVEETINQIVSELSVTFNDRIDQLADRLYDQAIGQVRDYLDHNVGPIEIDLTDIRGTLNSAIRMESVEWGLEQLTEELIGEVASGELHERLGDLLGGELPPEVSEFLNRGPDFVDRYLDKVREYLPGKQFDEKVNQLIHLPLFELPNSIYCVVLSTSATRHFAAAFKGPTVDPEEIRRGVEVTRVLIWQALNREGLSVDLKSLVDMTTLVSDNLGISLSDLGDVGRAIQVSKEKWDELREGLDQIDQMIEKPLGTISSELRGAVHDIEDLLSEIQDTIAAPVQDIYKEGDAAVDQFRNDVIAMVPDEVRGVPTDWEAVKEQLGIDGGLLGEIGEQSPWDVIHDFAKESGIIDAYEKLKRGVKDGLEDLNEMVSEGLANAATEVADVFGMTDALARALSIEKMAASNPALESPLEPVLLDNAEFYHRVTDLYIPAEEIPFEFSRVYRNRADFKGVLGHNWHHNYEERLVPSPQELIHIDGRGRSFRLTQIGKTKDGYFLRSPDGVLTYFDRGGLLVRKEKNGLQVTFHYDRFNRLSRVVDTKGRSARYRYHSDGFLSEVEDFAGRRISFDYDTGGNLVSMTTPRTVDYKEGKTVRYDYDSNHNIIGITDPKGQRYLINEYGKEGIMKGRIKRQRYGLKSRWMIVSYRYFLPDYLRRWIQNPKRSFRQIEVTDRRGQRHRYEINALGQTVVEYVEGKEVVKRKQNKTQRSTGVDHYRYKRNALGQVTEITSPDGETTRFILNARGQILQERKVGVNGAIRYRFDENDNIAEVRIEEPEKDDLVYRFRYDDMDQLIAFVQSVDPGRSITTTYEYGPGGGLVNPRSPRGLRAVVKWLKSDFRAEKDIRGNVTALIDPFGFRREYSFDGLGRRVAVRQQVSRDEWESVQYTWDDQHRLVSAVGPRGDKIDFVGDRSMPSINDNEESGTALLNYPSGDVVYRERDERGRINEVYYKGKRLIEIEYDGGGRIKQQRFANGIQEVREFGGGALVKETWLKGSEKIDEQSYVYDARGKLDGYHYDGTGQLIGHKVSTDDLLYDSNGNRSSDARYRYIYDANGRLLELRDRNGQRVATYQYDKGGRRISKRLFHNGSSTNIRYIYDGWNLIAEYENDRLKQSYIYAGFDRPIAFVDHYQEKLFYYHRNRRGSVAIVTDDAGEIVERYDYAPYGEAKSLPSRQNLTFTSAYFDTESGLYYMRHRYYDPKRGLFLTPDPLGHQLKMKTESQAVLPFHISYHRGGDFLAYPNPGNRNLFFNRIYFRQKGIEPVGEFDLYRYAANDPINYKDPLGLDYIWISGEYQKYPRGSGRYADLRLIWVAEHQGHGNPTADVLPPDYSAVSGPWGRGPLPSGDYDGHTMRRRKHPGMSIDKFGWSLNVDPDFETDRSLLRIHPDGNAFGSLGCVAVDRESYMGLYYRLEEYLESNDAIDMSVMIRDEGANPEGLDLYLNRHADWLMTF